MGLILKKKKKEKKEATFIHEPKKRKNIKNNKSARVPRSAPQTLKESCPPHAPGADSLDVVGKIVKYHPCYMPRGQIVP